MSDIDVEICVQDRAGAQVAYDGEATRIELCAALQIGGVTPSIASIAAARRITDRAGWLQVLIRPRGGGYRYRQDEIDLSCADIRAAVDAGADGVVVGALTDGLTIDEAALEQFVAAAGSATVTFHRAFDEIADPLTALATLANHGVARVLTSGGAGNAIAAVDQVKSLAAASSPVAIMAGGGVRGEHVPALIAAGVHAVHLSARVPADGGRGGDGDHWHTDPASVAAAVTAARTTH